MLEVTWENRCTYSARTSHSPQLFSVVGVRFGIWVEDGKRLSRHRQRYGAQLNKETQHIPSWVKVAVACALGFGTMIGRKRIVVTVGEKIGKEHLTYGQGASAELVAAATIGFADRFGLPVSTAHVLSSRVAGTMAVNHSGLQIQTLRNNVLAWVLTIPVCVLLGQVSSPSRFTSFSISSELGKRSAGKTPATIEVT